MILGPDKKKLSKRHGALSVMEYEKMGYLPEAVMNYLARLGWSHGDQEIFSREELIACFSTENLGNSPAVFDTQKLEWLNGHYMKQAEPVRLAALLREFLSREMEPAELEDVPQALLEAVTPLLQPRAKTLTDMAEMARLFLVDAPFLPFDEKAVAQHLGEANKTLVLEFADALEAHAGPFEEQDLEALAQAFVAARNIKFKALAQPLRVALTGRSVSPGLFETMRVLGKEQSLKRLRRVTEL
jgi:glutamyl-tRNA synthetase